MLEAKKYIYDFSEGDAGMKILLGGKGANLAQMWKIGLPVPPGFIITTEACHEYWKEKDFILNIWDEVKAAVSRSKLLPARNSEAKRSAAGFSSFRGTCIYARHDGYDP